MLNPTHTCNNRGITRIPAECDDIAQRSKTGRDKQSAGKMRAQIIGKSGLSRPPTR